MEINKQLFEDVLSGKLKGIFILRNGKKVDSKYCHRNISDYHASHPYRLSYNNHKSSYKSNGFCMICDVKFDFDIVDFIPDVNMKENKLTIEIPEGKIVDWEASQKQNKIVLKDKQLTYEDICNKLYENNPTFERQFKCLLAKNKLANVAKYLNDGWNPKSGELVFGLMLEGENHNIIFPIYNWNKDRYYFPQFAFKTIFLAQQAIEILGEETVKLALEPLGI